MTIFIQISIKLFVVTEIHKNVYFDYVKGNKSYSNVEFEEISILKKK